MFELIVHKVESDLGAFTSSCIPPNSSPPRQFTALDHLYRFTHHQNLFLLNTYLHYSHHHLSHVSSPVITRPDPGVLGSGLCGSSTDRDLTSACANIHLRPRNSPFRAHPCRQDSAPSMRQPTMFIWSRVSRDLTSISGYQHHPLHNLCPMLHHHLRY